MNFKKSLKIIGFLSVLSIILISFFTNRFCDDFYLEKDLQSKGVFEYMYHVFMTWDGRFISVASLIQFTAIKYLNHSLVVLLWTMFFVLNCILIFKIIISEIKPIYILKIGEIILPISVLIISIFYGFSTHISETVYWGTGGAYMVHVFMGLIWILFYREIIQNLKRTFIIIMFSLFSLIVGMHTQNLVICLLFLLAIEGVLNFYNNERRKLIIVCLFFICLLAGLLITSFSPGSLIRASSSPNSFDTNLSNYFKYLYLITKIFIRASIYLIPLSFISAVFVYLNIDLKYRNKIKSSDNKPIEFLIHTKWLIIASSSILPFLFIPNTVTYRSALFFMIFLYIYIVIFAIKIFNRFSSTYFLKFKPLLNIILLLLFICHFGYISYCYKFGFEYQKYMQSTDKFLQTKINTEGPVVIKKITVKNEPFVFKSSINLFISSDPTYWVNKEWEYYYGIKILKVE